MGISNGGGNSSQLGQAPDSAFSKDTLSIEINGPDRPRLTLIDIPGLIQSATRGVSENDVALVADITDRYIRRPRTICLAVVSATNDAANQPILQRVRRFDPRGDRTLGIITKPDQLPEGSGSESKLLELARNEDVFFKLGWHVVRNRRFSENEFSFWERNAAEMQFFRTLNFRNLPRDIVGIETLRARLSHLLFEHVSAAQRGSRAGSPGRQARVEFVGRCPVGSRDCRVYLAQLTMDCQEICRASLNGNYEHSYFKKGAEESFLLQSKSTIARLRAAVQYRNEVFAETLRQKGHRYHFVSTTEKGLVVAEDLDQNKTSMTPSPKPLSRKKSGAWVQKMLLRSRGTELIGNFNPRLIGELFWEQCQPWENLARNHIEQVGQLCRDFLANLLEQKVLKEMKGRIWTFMVQDTLAERKQAAYDELGKLMRDIKEFPINYNHYYTDTIEQRSQERLKIRLESLLPGTFAQAPPVNCNRGHHYDKFDPGMEMNNVISACLRSNVTSIDMNKFSSDEALDCLRAIYKVQYKTFVANVTTQVIERHMIRGLDRIFSPLVIISMADDKLEAIASERPESRRQRVFCRIVCRSWKRAAEFFRS
ncbi:P-loop containing nucleoside triphosphate hydrolase protein [Colletotrichum godetiae]|uniref:P-loop containing nucleoside triphosphate hydrolase protein n=1 Tax=Colletotrichum godetiae TaxID=1209918 RepID=A0AAJ0A8D1_9PEZI|nr:P-loop containing nucleoside triphosphate hydrolase protein [Colletotrichum godetiae]KAK1657773.1 P-loop containing nucleoside triphosphate hydrolase protein [Colletotrichum godetiae]